MFTFQIDKDTNDLVIGPDSNLQTVEGIDEERQSVRLLLSTNLNEWFLNIEHGLDYFVIQKKQFDIEEIRMAVMEALSQEERIADVNDLVISFDWGERRMTITFSLTMISGNVIEGTEVV